MTQTLEKDPLASVYVHFPYCLAKCPYCDFVSFASARDAIDHAGYADAVIREIDTRADALSGRRLGSIFFGGGTPSLWESAELGRVLARIREVVAPLPTEKWEVEVTVECNPTSLDEKTADALARAGVGRLSIGVQSLNDDRLRYLGRLHDADGARDAVRQAMRSGVGRVSADIIFGLPGQTSAEARDEALDLADLGLTHLSCYQLTIESGTRFGELARRGRLPLADDGVVAESFLAIDDALTARGMRHYEVSNYAHEGEEARHNLGYWRGEEYLGVGCAAFGFVRDGRGIHEPASGVRYRNAVQPERYVGDGTSESSESLDAPTLLRERIMLGLRVDEGIDIDAAALELRTSGWTPERRHAATWLEERGRIVRDGTRIRVPRAAWLWTDDTAARLF
jgi:putative oxygen-independent coproporphyrinogen III oxidase